MEPTAAPRPGDLWDGVELSGQKVPWVLAKGAVDGFSWRLKKIGLFNGFFDGF